MYLKLSSTKIGSQKSLGITLKRESLYRYFSDNCTCDRRHRSRLTIISRVGCAPKLFHDILHFHPRPLRRRSHGFNDDLTKIGINEKMQNRPEKLRGAAADNKIWKVAAATTIPRLEISPQGILLQYGCREISKALAYLVSLPSKAECTHEGSTLTTMKKKTMQEPSNTKVNV